jgi:phenylalanyl-tRNA synthetase beta chain
VPAKRGEKLKTLDGTERTLDPSFSVVCDGDRFARRGHRPGIMGGGATEISFSTKNVLIECAWFEPVAIRRALAS